MEIAWVKELGKHTLFWLQRCCQGISPALGRWTLTGVNQMIKYPSVPVRLAMWYNLSFHLDEWHWLNKVKYLASWAQKQKRRNAWYVFKNVMTHFPSLNSYCISYEILDSLLVSIFTHVEILCRLLVSQRGNDVILMFKLLVLSASISRWGSCRRWASPSPVWPDSMVCFALSSPTLFLLTALLQLLL